MGSTREDYERQLKWRLTQISIGKSTPAYISYSASISKNQLRRQHPSTPDPYDARMSKRQFEGRIKAWKRGFNERQVIVEQEGTKEGPVYFFLNKDEVVNFEHLQTDHRVTLIVDNVKNDLEDDSWMFTF